MKQMNAIAMLEHDHEKVRGLLDKLSSTTDRGVKKRRDLLTEIEHEVKIHTQLEEEIFYPAFKSAGTKKSDDKLYYEAKEEHHAADKVLADLKHADPSTAAFGGKAKVLKELIEHHAEEEESEMFPRAKEVMSKEELEQLGERMQQRKHDIERGLGWRRPSAAE